MRVEKLLKQLRREYLKVKVLQSLLDSLLFFLGANLLLFLFSVQVVSGVENITVLATASVLFLLGDLYYRFRRYSLELYEEENPELREILRTARDNLDRQNIVSQALFDELLEKARRVTSESIVPARSIIYKTLAVGALSFLTVVSGLADYQVIGNEVDLLQNPQELKNVVTGGGEEDGGLQNATDLYGQEAEADTGIDVEFNITGSAGSSSGEPSPVERPPREDLTLDSAASSSSENLELAKQYSVEVRELG